MRSKGVYAIYAMFFVACLVIFIAINQVAEGQLSQHSDAILIALITTFSAFIVFYDFRKRLPTSQIIAPILSFVLINCLAIIAIYIAGFSLSVGFLIPFFMVEGALVYWLLEKRASALGN